MPDPALVEHVETVLGNEHHANLCGCREWPDCINGLTPAFTLATEDILRIAAPLIEAQVRAKVAEEIAADILARLAAIGLRPTPWADGYTLASRYAAAVSRKHAVRMPDVAQEATSTPDAFPSEGPAVSDAHRAAQTDDRQEQ